MDIDRVYLFKSSENFMATIFGKVKSSPKAIFFVGKLKVRRKFYQKSLKGLRARVNFQGIS